MANKIIIDTGPLVAYLNRRDHHHEWVKKQFAQIIPPLLTCESVISEACFLVRGLAGGKEAIMDLLQRNLIIVSFNLNDEHAAVKKLLARYATLPTSLADAALVRMAEMHSNSQIFTLDKDFHVYRMHGRQTIPLITLKK